MTTIQSEVIDKLAAFDGIEVIARRVDRDADGGAICVRFAQAFARIGELRDFRRAIGLVEVVFGVNGEAGRRGATWNAKRAAAVRGAALFVPVGGFAQHEEIAAEVGGDAVERAEIGGELATRTPARDQAARGIELETLPSAVSPT